MQVPEKQQFHQRHFLKLLHGDPNVKLGLSARGMKKIADVRRVEQAVNRWATRKLHRVPIKSAQKALAALGDES